MGPLFLLHALDLGDGEPRGNGDIPDLQSHLEQLSCRGERLETLALDPALGLTFGSALFSVSRSDLLIDAEVKKSARLSS